MTYTHLNLPDSLFGQQLKPTKGDYRRSTIFARGASKQMLEDFRDSVLQEAENIQVYTVSGSITTGQDVVEVHIIADAK